MNDELYHYGVPGMKWGRRKQIVRTANRQVGKHANYYTKKNAVKKAIAADNMKRVKKYGASRVNASNVLRGAGAAAGAAFAFSVLRGIGKDKTTAVSGKILAGAAALGVTVGLTKRAVSSVKDIKQTNANRAKIKKNATKKK